MLKAWLEPALGGKMLAPGCEQRVEQALSHGENLNRKPFETPAIAHALQGKWRIGNGLSLTVRYNWLKCE